MKNVDHNKNADAMSNGDGSMYGAFDCRRGLVFSTVLAYSMTLLYMSCFNHVYYRLDV